MRCRPHYRPKPHPWVTLALLVSVLVGVIVGILSQPSPSNRTPSQTSTSDIYQTGTLR